MSEEGEAGEAPASEPAQGLPPAIDGTDGGDDADEAPAKEYDGKSYRSHPGYNPVDLEGLPPDTQKAIKARFDYFYRQINDQKKILGDYRGVAKSQSEKIEELMSGVGTMANHLQDKAFADTESQLKSTMRTALENGDNDAYLAAQDKLDDIRLEKKLAARDRKEAPKARTNGAEEPQYEESQLDPEDQQVVDSWQDERDESGSLLRPWAYNRGTPDKPDPVYMHALRETYAVLGNPRLQNLTMEQKMQEVDRRMGVSKQGGRQNVMGGNLTGRGKSSKVTLSSKQQEIAVRTKFGGPKAKSDAEHIDAYRKQVEKSKGART